MLKNVLPTLYFILSWTKFPEAGGKEGRTWKVDVLFMTEDKDEYIDKIFKILGFKQ